MNDQDFPGVGQNAARSAANRLDATLDVFVSPLRSVAQTGRRLLAFSLIVLATAVTKLNRAGVVVHPLIREQIWRAGLRLLPFVTLLAAVAGFVLIGQTVVLLRQVGRQDMLGTVVVFALFRELAPLVTAMFVLLRVGTATVVELATMRATGEVEALEALSIDPVHFLVLPRVIGLALSVFCLTVYFLISAIASGYGFCFVQDLPLSLGDYLTQIANALAWQDFLLLLVKTAGFGAAIAVITCYHGLARPLRLEEVPDAAMRAVSSCVAVCVLLDLLFLGAYLLL